MRKPSRYDPYLVDRDQAVWRFKFRNSWAYFCFMLVFAAAAVALLLLLD